MALMPLGRGRENAPNAVFLTRPFAVQKKTNFSSKAETGRTAVLDSCSCSFSRFAMERPRAVRAISGMSYTFSQYTRPRFVKNRR